MKKIIITFLSIIIVISFMAIGFYLGVRTIDSSMKGMSFTYYSIGKDYYDMEEYMKAIAFYNKAIALNLTDFWAHDSLANTYYLNGNYDLALEEYETSLHLALAQGGKLIVFKDEIEAQIKTIKSNLTKEENQKEESVQDARKNKYFYDTLKKIINAERGIEDWN